MRLVEREKGMKKEREDKTEGLLLLIKWTDQRREEKGGKRSDELK